MKNRLMGTLLAIAMILGYANISLAHEPYRKPSNVKTGVKIGAGAALGAGIGALLGGKRGAGAGALIGGGAMTAETMAKRDGNYDKKTRAIGTAAAGTAVGAGVGAAIGGGKGAGIGALLGGGGSTIYVLTRKDQR